VPTSSWPFLPIGVPAGQKGSEGIAGLKHKGSMEGKSVKLNKVRKMK
jgi:hypothetical protein